MSDQVSISTSHAPIIMGADEASLLSLWRQRLGEVEPVCLSRAMTVQLSKATAELNRRCYEAYSGHQVAVIRKRFQHRTMFWMSAVLRGLVEPAGDIFEAVFLPTASAFEQTAADTYMPALKHKMLVTGRARTVLSIITGDGKWIEATVAADAVYQTALIAAEKAFWRSVQIGRRPHLFGIAPRRSKIEVVRVIDAIGSGSRLSVEAPQAIDKSKLAMPEPRRWRDKDHLKFVATRPCVICGRRPSDAHHLRFAQPRALGRKVSDEFTVPLCRVHHRAVYHSGNEARWWSEARIDPLELADGLWRHTRRRQSRGFDANPPSGFASPDTEQPSALDRMQLGRARS